MKIIMDTTNNVARDSFVEGLIEESNYTDLTPEVHREIKNDLYKRLDDFILAKMIAAFSDEDLKKYEDLIDMKVPNEELQDFGPAHITDFPTFLTNVFLDFRSIYLGELEAPVFVPPITEDQKGE